MAWAQRGNRSYFYKSVRINGRPTKVYLGAGEEAEAAACEDADRRAKVAAERLRIAGLEVQIAAADGVLNELTAWTTLLFKAVLVVHGLHEHHGLWRRRVFVR